MNAIENNDSDKYCILFHMRHGNYKRMKEIVSMTSLWDIFELLNANDAIERKKKLT